MRQNICNICGANYEYRDGKWRCPACGAYKPEEVSGEEETLLYSAAQKLRLSAFDDAEEMYRDIVAQYPKNSRGYWGLVLAKYGIKYEKDCDGKTVKMIPSCYAASYERILDDENYKKALQYADKDNRAFYEEQAKRIEDVRRRWVEIAEREEPCDIFISYKDSDMENGIERTQDSYDAYELYNKLKEKGYRVFYSRESLAGKEGEKFEPYIFNALNTAQVMIVYGTKPEYIESTWVKNEWMRYYKRVRSGQKQENSLVLAYKGFNPSELPTPLCDIQGIDLGRITIGFGDLEAKVSEIISAARMRQKIARVSVKGREKRTAEHILRINTVEVGKVVSATSKGEREHIATRAIGGRSVKLSVSAEKSLKVAENYLERGQFAEAEDRFDEILQSDPHNGRSLTGKLLAQARAETMAVFERQGLGGRFDSAFIEKVLSYAERETAENVLGVLCAEASRSIEQGNSVLARQFISLVRDYDNASVNALREEIYEHGLRLIASDGEFAKYCLDTNLLFEADEVRYSQKLHTIVDIGIKRGNFAFAEYYADKLKEVDENSYSTQIALLEIEYSVSDDVEVFRHLEQSKDYAKIESVLSELDALSAEKWLRMCFVQITELLQKELFGGALRWIEVCAKYEFEGRKSLLESLLDICMKKASIRSADCFEAVLTYVADGESSVYATKANDFADAALKAKEFDAAKQYYGKVLSVSPGSVAAAQGVFFADICCASDKDLPSAIVRLTDWTSFEEVLVVQTDDADDLKWIEKLADACMEDIRREGQSVNENVFSVFEKLLSYIPEVSDSVLLHLLRQAAELCLKEGLFAQAQKFYEMFISVDAEDSAIYWGLLQAKLKCHNEEELVRQPQLIGQFAEFENAQVCAADEKKVLEHYIDIRDRQSKHIKSAKKRKRFIKIGSIMLAAVAVVVAALVGWLTYYDSQNQLLYHVGENGYTISAGKFYETESSLTIPAEWNGDPVVAIGSDAFSGHEEIEEVVLPASIETIGANAFADCVNLKSVVFITDASARTIAPQTALREIGDGAFSGCKNLETFDLPYGIERIGARAFAGTDLHEATIPNTVNHVGSSAFDGCNRLQTIIVGDREEIPTEWAGNWQDGCDAMVEFRLRVIFEYNGAMAGNTINEQYVLYGGEFHFPVPERKGYAFYGWFRGDTRLTDDRGNSLADWQYKDGGTVTAEWVPNVNRIVFDANGGSGDMQEQGGATDETVILSANTFTRSGYTFAGWAESATGSVIYEDGAEYIMGAESSYKLFAVWTANSNEILFDGNGATGGSMENQFMATDSYASLTKNAFVKTGYQFVGWSTSADGGAIYADQAIYTMGTEARYTLYAVWETVDYTIRYYLNNGIAGDNPSSYTIESEDIILKAATRAGYRFTGWTGTGLSAPTLSVTIHMGSTGNREYTATWEANTNQVIFNANGGKGEMPAQSIRTDETVPLSSNLFTREGYAFVGWAEAQSGGSEYSDGANYTMGAESEYTLYAVWRAIEYTISYTLNGGNVSGNPDNYTIESDTFRIGNPVRAGYTFTGWTGTGLEEPMLVVTVVQGSMGNREYTATWQANLNKIIFHANGGDGVMSAQEIGTDASAQLSACTFMRPGYTFIGWATSENGAAVYEDGDTYIMGTEPEYDLYAAWELIEYSIQYMLNGGTALGNPEMFTVITPEFTLNAPVRDGYTFTGWSGTGIDGFSMAVTIPTGSMENREYTANWEANENKVIFHANGGSGEMQPQTIKTDVSAALSENAFVYSGYTFTGWATEPEEDIAFEDGAEYFMGTAAEYHLYAVWTPNLNSIIFDGNGADSGEMAVQTGYTDSEVALTLNSYQRRGYRFLGWATEKDGAVVYADGERIVVGHETAMTLYAKWEALSYKVTLVSVENNIAEEHVTFGSEYSFLVPERRGYMFGGWYSAPGGGGTKYADEEGKGIGVWSYDGDITLYSYWLGTDGLAYILNESGTYTLTGTTGASIDLNAAGGFIATLQIEGWHYDSAVKENVVTGVIAADGSLVLKVYYSKDDPVMYTVTFMNGEEQFGTPVSVSANSTVAQPSSEPEKQGYVFDGWYTDAACGQADKFDFKTPITENTVLYAGWKPAENTAYSVRVFAWDGSAYPEVTEDDRLTDILAGLTAATEEEIDFAAQEGEYKTLADQIAAALGALYELNKEKGTLKGTVAADGSTQFELYFSAKEGMENLLVAADTSVERHAGTNNTGFETEEIAVSSIDETAKAGFDMLGLSDTDVLKLTITSANSLIVFNTVPQLQNWSGYDYIGFWVYNGSASEMYARTRRMAVQMYVGTSVRMHPGEWTFVMFDLHKYPVGAWDQVYDLDGVKEYAIEFEKNGNSSAIAVDSVFYFSSIRGYKYVNGAREENVVERMDEVVGVGAIADATERIAGGGYAFDVSLEKVNTGDGEGPMTKVEYLLNVKDAAVNDNFRRNLIFPGVLNTDTRYSAYRFDVYNANDYEITILGQKIAAKTTQQITVQCVKTEQGGDNASAGWGSYYRMRWYPHDGNDVTPKGLTIYIGNIYGVPKT